MTRAERKRRTIARATEVVMERRKATGLAWLRLELERQLLPYYFVSPPAWRIRLRAWMPGERARPDFLSLGAVRSGTSSLSDYLMEHPSVVLPLAKELSHGDIATWRWYGAQMPTERAMRRARRQLGTALTGYCNPRVPDLRLPWLASGIDRPLGHLLVVLIVRDPIARAWSHYRWDRMWAAEVPDRLFGAWPSFEETIEVELAAIAEGVSSEAVAGMGLGYLEPGVYAPYVRHLFEHFGRERVHVVNASDFFREPIPVMQEVYRFLGLPPFEPSVGDAKNPSADLGEMSPEIRERLREHYRPHNEALSALIGRDLGWP